MASSPSDDGTPSELRELAEDALAYDGRWSELTAKVEIEKLARGLLSALDALEAANERLQEGGNHALRLLDRASAAEAALEAADKRAEEYRTGEAITFELQKLAEAERDQAIKERDHYKHFLAGLADTASDPEDRKIARAALAGVPGGSPEEHPEEHNPGGTAVAVPGSKGGEAIMDLPEEPKAITDALRLVDSFSDLARAAFTVACYHQSGGDGWWEAHDDLYRQLRSLGYDLGGTGALDE